MIQPERIKRIKDYTKFSGSFVLYWMQQAQRTRYNHALAYAIDAANELSLPVLVYFGLTPRYPGANLRHYAFMVQGLRDVQESLGKLGITFIVNIGDPVERLVELARDAAFVVFDRGYTREQRSWRKAAARTIDCPVVQVETDVIVPVELVSPKEEFSAATIRRKIEWQLGRFLVPLENREPMHKFAARPDSIDVSDWEKVLTLLDVDTSVQPVTWLMGGQEEAERRLEAFIDGKLKYYDTLRNDPSRDYLSHLSPYLHFGQISPLHIALEVAATKYAARSAFLEELIVRRELAMNFAYYNPQYDTYDSIPAWSKRTLLEHEADTRAYTYSRRKLETAQTHDPYWNAAQNELVHRGKMHGYMRMYWGKKLLEWSPSPRVAYDIAVYLNDKYSLDGRDPNGYAGISWCFGKHDRPWREREIFGKVRYMNDRGLERKFDMDAYVRAVQIFDHDTGITK